MALSWNEIKRRAITFSKEWGNASSETSEKQTFWNEFFNVFGISRRRVATFEQHVKLLDDKTGFIDLFWKGELVVEHKSKGKDLDSAFIQAIDYLDGLEEKELPRYVIVSDFDLFQLSDLETDTQVRFHLSELHNNVHYLDFIAGYKKKEYKPEDPVNIEAAELMANLHDLLEESGYKGHKLEILLVRLLFCLFADDTGIFEKDIFKDFIEIRTAEDGSDLGPKINQLFQVLDTKIKDRQTNLDEDLQRFPYINGDLFEENITIASFDYAMRQSLLDCSYFEWSQISPAIFGSMFQGVMDPDERHNLGAHYTSEKNITKLINPLFLDELRARFNRIKHNKNKLRELLAELADIKIFDPACGCGNFLIIAYRELRKLELDILKELYTDQGELDITVLCNVDVDQLYGIEYEEFPARIAEVAIWLIDHQMNLEVSEAFGQYYARLPLKKSANIINENSLRLDWNDVISNQEVDYVLGNPPFVSKNDRSKEQKKDMSLVFTNVRSFKILDYVTSWFVKASNYIQNTSIKVGFVATNSIAQGEQVGKLWQILFERDCKIHFAHKTFKWTNKAKNQASVYVVIIGFGNFDISEKRLFDYENPKADPHEVEVNNINPYLVDYEDLLVLSRTKPIDDVPEMMFGNKKVDYGYLIFNGDEEKNEFLSKEPEAEKFIRPFLSGKEFLRNKNRWCLWFKNASPEELRNMPLVRERLDQIREKRSNSTKKATQKMADYPYLFGEIRQPENDFLLIPRTTSENRTYIPLAYFPSSYIISSSCMALPNATPFHFGVLTSLMHMTWMKYVCGRLKGDYRYSNKLVYNNFPWPKEPLDKNVKKVKEAAQQVLEIRDSYPDSALVDLYDSLTMPKDLRDVHKQLDKAVDLCYRPQPFPDERRRIEFLFDLYKQITEPLGVG
jgi:type I restriction-modification system DNA methylase subunit